MSYGTALATIIDLDRFRLSELRVPMPADTEAERTVTRTLMNLLRFKRRPKLTYQHSADSPPELKGHR
jgi:hypothetical protein